HNPLWGPFARARVRPADSWDAWPGNARRNHPPPGGPLAAPLPTGLIACHRPIGRNLCASFDSTFDCSRRQSESAPLAGRRQTGDLYLETTLMSDRPDDDPPPPDGYDPRYNPTAFYVQLLSAHDQSAMNGRPLLTEAGVEQVQKFLQDERAGHDGA